MNMSTNDQEQVGSARELRASLKSKQSDKAKLQLLTTLGMRVFTNGWEHTNAQWLLDEACLVLGAPHAVFASHEGNTLQVTASRGNAFNVGTRIPLMGQIAATIRSPCLFKTYSLQTALWPSNAHQTLHFVVAPIAYAEQPLGIFAFATVEAELSHEDIALCHSICGLVGMAMQKSTAQPTAKADQTILNVLTPREREIFALLPSGASNAMLASKLGIAAGTVKIHVERILSKLGLTDRTQAAVKAVELGYSSSTFASNKEE
jgi:DNA-binding CsgD family transcriptional regulator